MKTQVAAVSFNMGNSSSINKLKDRVFHISDGALVLEPPHAKKPLALVFPGLRLRSLIDQGANGLVFEAVDNISRVVAVKLWFRSRRDKIAQAHREIQKLAAMGNHPLIVVVHRFDVVSGYPYAVMERVQGVSLRKWLGSKAGIPSLTHQELEERYTIWELFSEALYRAYEMDILHGDPHTGNILVFADKLDDYKGFRTLQFRKLGVKVTDFGSSLLWSSKIGLVERECKVLEETALRLFGRGVRPALESVPPQDPSAILNRVNFFMRSGLFADE